jgi:hypothetical protein
VCGGLIFCQICQLRSRQREDGLDRKQASVAFSTADSTMSGQIALSSEIVNKSKLRKRSQIVWGGDRQVSPRELTPAGRNENRPATVLRQSGDGFRSGFEHFDG